MTITLDKASVTVEDGKIIIDCDSVELENIITRNCGEVPLSQLKPGTYFKLSNDEEFMVLEHTDEGTKVIRKNFLEGSYMFGNTNDWKDSPIRNELLGKKYLDKIYSLVGDKIIPMVRDLTSLDGLDDYGVCTDKISLLSAAEYAKYHKLLGLKSNYPRWQWTITSASTPSNDYSRFVCCVNSGGVLNWYVCGCSGGVRPFLMLDSSIFVLAD